MKRLALIILALISMFTVFAGITGAVCDPAPTPNDDNITCTDFTFTLEADGDTSVDAFGNDTVTNNSTMAEIIADSVDGDGYGNDTIINNGIIDFILTDTVFGDGYGNDTIINNGMIFVLLAGSLFGDDFSDDVIINNGEVDDIYSDSVLGDGYGDDVIINNGEVYDIFGDSEDGDGYGDDVIINNGLANDIHGDSYEGDGYGDDIIINNNVADDIYGDSEDGNGYGDDIIINNGEVDKIFSDSRYGTGSGDDVVINNGIVTGYIVTGGGNDRVQFSSPIYGLIDGGDGYDILEAVTTVCHGSASVDEIRTFLDADPSGDSVTLNGNVYIWTNFEELRAIIQSYFCDGRIQATDFATPIVVYCNVFGGLDIYDVASIGESGRTEEGLLTMRSDRQALVDILALAVSTGQHQLVSQDEFGNQLWALSSNELQIMGPEVNEPSKTYEFILSPGLCGI